MIAQWQNSRAIGERIFICADLELVSPTHIGCGDVDSLLDMPLARDPLTGKALLAGASLAGALRAYLVRNGKTMWANQLFGQVDQKIGYESLLIVDDAIGEIPHLEIRDGVTIDPSTRTAVDKKKYDFELMPAGMKFSPCFELIVPPQKEYLIEAFTFALKGLESGEITLGKRKRRGFGECSVKNWKTWRFPWNTEGMLAWVIFDNKTSLPHKDNKKIDQLLLNKDLTVPVEGNRCVLSATFLLASSMLIRSETEKKQSNSSQPDTRHLRRKRNGNEELIISGTSLAGVLRARTSRICNTLGKNGEKIAANLFGDSPEGQQNNKSERATASRVWVKESVIQSPQNPLEMVQTRVTIDRFTGGALESRLFSEQPVFGDQQTTVTLKIEIEKAEPFEVGILLLLLKDLWLGDLPLGGQSSVGRGILHGLQAELQYQGNNWSLTNTDEGVEIQGASTEVLSKYIDSLKAEG